MGHTWFETRPFYLCIKGWSTSYIESSPFSLRSTVIHHMSSSSPTVPSCVVVRTPESFRRGVLRCHLESERTSHSGQPDCITYHPTPSPHTSFSSFGVRPLVVRIPSPSFVPHVLFLLIQSSGPRFLRSSHHSPSGGDL